MSDYEIQESGEGLLFFVWFYEEELVGLGGSDGTICVSNRRNSDIDTHPLQNLLQVSDIPFPHGFPIRSSTPDNKWSVLRYET